MARVCKPGGTLAILEFSLPKNVVVRTFYLWYFRNVLPWIGNAVARNRSDAYSYLNQSVEEFPSGERLAALVRAAGFEKVEMIPLSLGIATLIRSKTLEKKPSTIMRTAVLRGMPRLCK